MHLILFIGIPGSGKSTFYIQYFFHTHMRINLDMLRTRNRENKLLEFCFQTQMPLVVDNTNVTREERKKYIETAKARKYKVTGYYFESSLQQSLERNAKRTGKQQVSEKGVKAKYYQLQLPDVAEGFDELFYVRSSGNQTLTLAPGIMKFDDFDAHMRQYETAHDQWIAPGFYVVARLDGRGFTKLTKEKLDMEKPFAVEFRDAMAATVKHLMNCGARVVYGYTQSDEISLLFHREDNAFNRKHRKLLSVLAGEASAAFTHHLKHIGVLDCRLSILPNEQKVQDYFAWRLEDAHRNSLNAYGYWKLREQGKSVAEATKQLKSLLVAEKNELLFSMGINYNNLPAWQKRGMGFYWKMQEKQGFNPVTSQETKVLRKVLYQELELPLTAYKPLIAQLIQISESEV